MKEEIYREPFRRKRDDTSVTEIKINNHTLDVVRIAIITMMGILRICESLAFKLLCIYLPGSSQILPPTPPTLDSLDGTLSVSLLALLYCPNYLC